MLRIAANPANVLTLVAMFRPAFSPERMKDALRAGIAYARGRDIPVPEEVEDEAPARPPTTPPATTLTGNEGGFLWKPVSESTGKLVVLLPSAYTGKTDRKAILTTPDGATQTAKYHGVHNGNREHYRYAKPGKDYPAGTTISIVAQGATWIWTVAKPSERNTNNKARKL